MYVQFVHIARPRRLCLFFVKGRSQLTKKILISTAGFLQGINRDLLYLQEEQLWECRHLHTTTRQSQQRQLGHVYLHSGRSKVSNTSRIACLLHYFFNAYRLYCLFSSGSLLGLSTPNSPFSPVANPSPTQSA